MARIVVTVPPRFAPVTALLAGRYITTAELSERWRYSEQTLRNARATGIGLPYASLPTGGVRYRLDEVIAAELAGTRGALSVYRVALELAAMPEVPEALAKVIVDRLREVQGLNKSVPPLTPEY